MKKVNPFDAILKEASAKKAVVKSLGDYEVTYREITRGEEDEFSKRYIKGVDPETGKPDVDINAFSEARYEKVASCLIDPVVTVDQLKKMPASKANEIINEIMNLIEPSEEVIDEEGKQES
jgi:hypothetical protein